MGIFKLFNNPATVMIRPCIPYGGLKADGSHDHRTNKGGDRTAAQKAGDRKRRKSK